MKKADFMKRTIESHMLRTTDLAQVTSLVSERLNARDMAAKTNYFERKGILIRDFISGTVDKSFEKWLAIQKHDVATVNSLYEWRKAVRIAEMQTADDIYELEQLAENPALKGYVEPILERKKIECQKLLSLQWELEDAIERVKATKYTARATA